MSYHRRGSSSYVVIRKQGISPVRIVRHSLSKKKAQNEADFLNSQFKDRKDTKFVVRVARALRTTLCITEPSFSPRIVACLQMCYLRVARCFTVFFKYPSNISRISCANNPYSHGSLYVNLGSLQSSRVIDVNRLDIRELVYSFDSPLSCSYARVLHSSKGKVNL